MNRRTNKNTKIIDFIFTHIQDNFKYYTVFFIIFAIGIIIGTVFINNISENGKQEIITYINNFIFSLKEKEINNFSLLKISIKNNFVLGLVLWFLGSTIIGIFVIALIIGFRGFCLGYTISAIVATFGTSKGLLLLSTLILQNFILIPSIIALAVSGANLCSITLKNIKKTSVKSELIKHTFFSFIIMLLLLLSSIVEVFVSKNLLIFLIKYF